MAKLGKAGVPTNKEQKRLALITRVGNHSRRNLAIIAVSYRLGLRAKEIAGLRVSDVIEKVEHLREECKLTTSMTKGVRPCVAYLTNPVIRNALNDYLNHRYQVEGILLNTSSALFKSQKGNHFSPNSIQQLLARLTNAPELLAAEATREGDGLQLNSSAKALI